MTEEEKKEIKTRNLGTLSKMWEIYQADSKFYTNEYFVVSVLLSSTMLCLTYSFHNNVYEVLQSIANLSISILPNLLGFSLGAYILIVGFGSTDILSKIITPLKGQKNFSFYQKLIAVFGVTVLVQIFALSISFVVVYLDKILPAVNISATVISNACAATVNLFVLFLVSFAGFYSIMMLANVIKQIFVFAQTVHFIITIDKSKD